MTLQALVEPEQVSSVILRPLKDRERNEAALLFYRTWLILILGLTAAWPQATIPAESASAAPAERTELSVVAGDTPRSVRITGPKSLTDLGKGKYGKWVGCSYSIQWGDGSGSPAGPIGADCGHGLSHTYKDAGTYRIVAKTFHPAPNDSHIDDWVGEATFVAK